MKKTSLLIFLFVFVKIAWASVIITEIMYAPNISSDYEWIELYNNGTEEIDLKDFKINNYNFEDVKIKPFEYIVVARELIDGSDTDNYSFECFYGNCDGVWDGHDEDYKTIDGYFALNNEGGIINLSNGSYEEIVVYEPSIGGLKNGKTLERSLESGVWEESRIIGGTPGERNSIESSKGIEFVFYVNNTKPKLINISLTDDLKEKGIQIIPYENRHIETTIIVKDENGFEDIKYVIVYFENKSIKLNFSRNISVSEAIFTGNFPVKCLDSKEHILKVEIADDKYLVEYNTTIECVKTMAIEIFPKFIDFGNILPGMTIEKNFTLLNNGNVPINVKINKESDVKILGSYENSGWSKLPISIFLLPNERKTIFLKLETKEGMKNGWYMGKILFEYEVAK